MSMRPWHSYGSSWHGKGFVKRGYFHGRRSWRSRPFYKRSFRKRTEEEEDDDVEPEIKDEVGADDDDEEVQEEQTQEDAEEDKKKVSLEEKKDLDEADDVKNSADNGDKKLDVAESDKAGESAKVTSKHEIDKMMLSDEWEVMDETDDEDEEGKKERLAKDILCIETGVPEVIDQLKEVKEPLIGLEYFVEIKNEEGTTYYSCALCKRPGRIAALLRHLNYMEHKLRYLEKHLKEVADAFPRGHPTTFKHEYLVAMEKLCDLLSKCNTIPEKFLITTKNFYSRSLMALVFRAEQLPHMEFKDESWKKIFEELDLPLNCRKTRYHKDYRSKSPGREKRSRSRDRDRSPYQNRREHYKDRDDYYPSYGRRARYHKWVPYHQYKYQNYYREWVPRNYMPDSDYYYYNDRPWHDNRSRGYYHQDDDYRGYGRSSGRSYHEREAHSSRHESPKREDDHHRYSSTRESGGIYATTIKSKSAQVDKSASKKEEKKPTSAADVKKLWDKLTKPEEKKKSGDASLKSFWDQWLDGHNDEEEDSNSKESHEVTIIDQASGASKSRPDLNSVAEMLDKNLTKIMDSYDQHSDQMHPAYGKSDGQLVGDKAAKAVLAQKIAKALTTMGMSNIPQETLLLVLQELGLLPGGHAVGTQSSRAMDNLRRTIVKFESVSQNFPR